MQRKALFAVVLLGLALFPVSSGATALCASEDLSWLEAIVDTPSPNFKSTCTASCGTSTVSCTSSGSCTAVDRNCPTTPGYVVCGGTTTSCHACACTNGAKRYTQLSSCCYNEVVGQCRRTLREETCINGNWRFSANTCDGLNCSGNCPL